MKCRGDVIRDFTVVMTSSGLDNVITDEDGEEEQPEILWANLSLEFDQDTKRTTAGGIILEMTFLKEPEFYAIIGGVVGFWVRLKQLSKM